MREFGIVPATGDDVDLVAGIIAQAFQHLAVASWLVPHAPDRLRVLRDNMTIWVDHALGDARGHAALTQDRQATAVWFPVGTNRFVPTAPPPPPRDYERRLQAACGRYTPRFRQLDHAFDRHHPHDGPHDHLAFLAVTPRHQRRGHGSALLSAFHSQSAGTASYLEASSADSRELYLRHGYRDAGEPFHLPDGGPPLWPMWRSPQ